MSGLRQRAAPKTGTTAVQSEFYTEHDNDAFLPRISAHDSNFDDAYPEKVSQPLSHGKKGGVKSTQQVPFSPTMTTNIEKHNGFDPSDWIYKYEKWMPLIVGLLAAATRYYRLTSPPGVVFDEIHFGHFTNWYSAHLYYFDIHPPLGKLVFWAVAQLFGYDHTKCEFEEINKDYGEDCKYYIMRATSSAFSVLTCVLLYCCARNFGASVYGGLITASLIIFDNLNLTESRLVLIDSQLLFWCVASLWVSQCWWKRLNEHSEAESLYLAANSATTSQFCAHLAAPSGSLNDVKVAPRPLSEIGRILWCIAVGFTCANAFSIKMTGLATPAFVAVESFFGLWFLKKAVRFPELILVLIAAFFTYSLWFACHFAMQWNTGPNRVEEEFMTPLYQSTLVGARNYDPSGQSLIEWRAKEGFWWTMITHNIRMVVHNAAILEPHHWQSTWWEWMLDLRGVAYYGKDARPGWHSQVYLIGNPAALWSVLVFLALAFAFCFVYVRYRSQLVEGSNMHGLFRQITFCFAVFCLNLAPYMGVKRSTFVYHYMPALVYGHLITGRIIDAVTPKKYLPVVTKMYILFVIVGWMFMAPWVYALPVTPDAHDRRRLMPRWN